MSLLPALRWLPLAFLATLGLAGCGKPAAQVVGQVTYNGVPAANAEIMLQAADDPKQQFFGATGSDGTIHLTYKDRAGVLPGRYLIRVTHASLADGKSLPAGEEGAALRHSDKAVTRTFAFDRELVEGENPVELKLENGRVEIDEAEAVEPVW